MNLSATTFCLMALWWFALAGCTAHIPRREVEADTLAWNKNIASGRAAWLEEARKRFPDPFVFVCHGDSSGKDWRAAPDRRYLNTDVETIGWLLHSLMPDRDVVLVCCNEMGLKPRLPRRVWYSDCGSVWSEPGPDDRWYGWGIGSIFEFVEGSEKE